MKLLGARTLLGAPGLTTRNKKLLVFTWKNRLLTELFARKAPGLRTRGVECGSIGFWLLYFGAVPWVLAFALGFRRVQKAEGLALTDR